MDHSGDFIFFFSYAFVRTLKSSRDRVVCNNTNTRNATKRILTCHKFIQRIFLSKYEWPTKLKLVLVLWNHIDSYVKFSTATRIKMKWNELYFRYKSTQKTTDKKKHGWNKIEKISSPIDRKWCSSLTTRFSFFTFTATHGIILWCQ